MPLYMCNCRCVEQRIPGRVRHIECEACGQTMVGGTTISPKLRRKLSRATWEEGDAASFVDHINETTVCEAEVIDSTSPLGQALTTCLATRRDFSAIHRNRGHLAGRPGFASSDFKKRAALRQACDRLLNPPPLHVKHTFDQHHPAVLGKLVENEFAHRAERNVSANVISTEKVTHKIIHPLLGVELHVSSDGTAEALLPLEIKSLKQHPWDHKGRGRLYGMLNQIGLQAFAFGVDEAVLLILERRFNGTGKFVALRVRNLLTYHLESLRFWLSQDPELAGLLQQLSGGGPIDG